jgi:hypothetical protein
VAGREVAARGGEWGKVRTRGMPLGTFLHTRDAFPSLLFVSIFCR